MLRPVATARRWDERTPVLVGAGQCANRGEPRHPMDLLEEAARAALADAGPDLRPSLDAIWVPGILSHAVPAPATALAHRLGAPARDRRTSTIGGNTPQALVAAACDAIVAGDLRAVLIAGAEAGWSARQAGGADATDPSYASDAVFGDRRDGVGPAEVRAGLFLPGRVYPLFESVLADAAGRDANAQREWIGRILSAMGERAVRYPDLAWFPNPRSAEEIATPGESNRLTAEPYTKLMNSIIAVDQGAALLLTSVGEARRKGLADERWIFPWSAATCNDVFLPCERPDLGRSPGYAAAACAALAAARIAIDDVGAFDLYSCFPSSVQLAAHELGISPLDERGLTVTGGMPQFGGAGNNYTTHAIACMRDELLRGRGTIGLVSGLGWYMTKHSVGLYGTSPPALGWAHPSCVAEQEAIDATALTVRDDADGVAVVEANTVVYDRDGAAAEAPVFARLPDGTRAVAPAADAAIAAEVAGKRLVGCAVRCRSGHDGTVWEPLPS
jgi:acetyl-CoA C-acetyltransferase